jgi:hypothetical protein
VAIVIKKRVSLDFLGEEYKGSYLIVGAVPISEIESMKNEKVYEVVEKHFIEGKIKQGDEFVDITKDNIKELSGDVFVKVFDVISGKLSPKLDEQL